jgi:flagellar biosynthesis protein FlhG
LRPLEDQNHYEALEVPFDATRDEIERAYRMARASFADDSMALYSVFAPGDSGEILQRLDIAYRILSDVETRRTYDREIRLEAPPREEESDAPERQVSTESTEHTSSQSVSVVQPLEAFGDMEADDENGEFDGARLRRARLRRGIELDQIAQVTKISLAYLSSIEADQYEDLPAAVYVRGFLTAYAKSIGVEPARVTSSYLARMDGTRQDKRSGRLLGRR